MITRFAPSPTGRLHLGHAFSALKIWQMAGDNPVRLRIEDVDSARSRPEFVDGILEDLKWLGLYWSGPVICQSSRIASYQRVIDQLAARDLVYPCRCTRRDIITAGAVHGTDGMVYPGTCRDRHMSDLAPDDAIRLNISRAMTGLELSDICDTGPLHPGLHRIDRDGLQRDLGDPVLRRRENGDMSYILACAHDDAAQDVTHVIRGDDLWGQTPLQVLLQAVMGWPTPTYHHHALITDETGKRLAKISKSKSLDALRADGATPGDIRQMVGL